MGNVPGKLDDQGNYGQHEGGNYRSNNGRSLSASFASGNPIENGNSAVVRSRRGTSLVGNVLSASGRSRADSVNGTSPYKKRSTKEREQAKERHARELIVKYDQCVDGGFLAPYGSYGSDKLDFDASIVKDLIISRKLAPFYTPLQDFDESWTRDELIKIVDGLPLHEPFNENPEEFEDIPVGNIRKQNFDDLIDKSLPKREQRRLRSKIFRARLYRKRMLWQEMENEGFLEQKLEARRESSLTKSNQWLFSDDLKYSLYEDGMECPICFLYFPKPLNYTRCCLQPICTECFVQIKRADPHFPHDEVDPTQPVTDDTDKDPNLLTSEPTNCVYCATSNFGITFQPVTERRVGIGGIPPSTFTIPEMKTDKISDKNSTTDEGASDNDKKNQPSNTRESEVNGSARREESRARRGSRSHNDPMVVSSDAIRPDWNTKLNKERMRLAKRSATATAIHVSNQLVDPEHASRRGSNVDLEYSSSFNSSRANRPRASSMLDPGITDAENEMIQQAIRLSLADQKQTKKNKTHVKS